MSLTLRHVSKHFYKFNAVQDVSFHLDRGEVVGFLGPNGAGKTTTMRMVAKLIRPSSGSIECSGRLSAMIEEPSFYPYLSGYQNLEYTASLSGIPTSQIQPALDRVGLLERQHHRVRTYSQGMRQRLGLARTLLGNPDVLLLDEPTNGLDPQGVAEMRDLIRAISEDGITVLLSSHILAEVEKIAPRVIIINKGVIQADGRIRELFTQLGEDGVSISFDLPEAFMEQALALLRSQAWVQQAYQSASGVVVARILQRDLDQVAPAFTHGHIPLLGFKPDVESLEQIYLRAVAETQQGVKA